MAEGKRYGTQFGRAVTQRMGSKWTPEKAKFFDAWAKAEGTVAEFNPFATTRRGYQGETNFNSVGVKHYPSFQTGVQATYDTINNGRYDQLVNLLRRDDVTAEQLAVAVANSPWGTGTGVLRVLGATGADLLQKGAEGAANTKNKAMLEAQYRNLEPPAPPRPSLAERVQSLAPSQNYLATVGGFGPLSKRTTQFAASLGDWEGLDDTPIPSEPTPVDLGEVAPGEGPELSEPRTERPFTGKVLQLPTSWKPTHVTDGLGWDTYTARDIMGRAGTGVGAPEAGVIEQWNPTGAQGGGSMWFRAKSGATYWLGHLANGLAPGTRVKKGQVIGTISADHANPHVHIDRRGPRKKKGAKT